MTLVGLIQGNLIRTHWARIGKNFGDCLSPIVLAHYGFQPVFSTQHNKSDVVVAGTLLQCLREDYRGYVIGAGGDLLEYAFPNAKIIGVRGKRTLQNLKNAPTECVLGDPGLLMSLIYRGDVDKKWRLGIVPHFVDAEHPQIKTLKNKLGDACKIIHVCRNPKKVIDEIRSCDFIASSSLHGLVIADSYGIPNIRIVIRDTMPTFFYDYKFYDYYSAFDCEHQVIEINASTDPEYLVSVCTTNTSAIKPIIQDLDAAFTEFRQSYRSGGLL
jgi:pyruvyltransferase